MNGNVTYNGSQLLSGAINVNTTGNIQALNVQITENGERTITPPEGVDGYAPITIDTNVPIPEPVLDTLNVTSNGTYTPPSGVDGYDEITVNVSQDVDIQPLTRTITTNGTTIINAFDLNVDGFNPVTITTAVDGYTIKTLANTPLPIASFNDGTSNPLKSLTASIVPVQAGSGDPSPSNVRPISGWTEEVITVTDDLQNPTVTHTTTIPFTDGQGQSVEVFGGSVDVTGGSATEEMTVIDLGDLTWTYDSAYNRFESSGIVDMKKADTRTMQIYASCYESLWHGEPFNNDWDNVIYNGVNDNVANVCVHDHRYTDVTSFTAAVIGQKLVYKLATPITIQLTPTSIKSLDGENNVSASTGDVEELKYFADL